MKIIRANDYADMSRKAANILSAQIILKPDCVLGLATGGTPVGAYQQLVEWYNKGDLDFSGVTTVNLDEYRRSRGRCQRSAATAPRWRHRCPAPGTSSWPTARTGWPRWTTAPGRSWCTRARAA